MLIRLQKYLANCGVASRRKSEELILNGDVKVNDVVVTELGVQIDEENDTVKFRGKIVKLEKNKIYIMLNKPHGYVTTVSDQFGRPTVMDLLRGVKERVFPIGRLDYDTSGLLLLSNDGDLTYKLTHPKHGIKKVYIAKIIGTPTEKSLEMFRTGLQIENYKTAKADVELVQSGEQYSILKISIIEGKNRQVRKMCEAIGHRVVSLKRIATGELQLGDLQSGSYRELTKDEIRYLTDFS